LTCKNFFLAFVQHLSSRDFKTLDADVRNSIERVLIHAPYGGKEARLGTWRALVEAQKSGKVRSIGVSNYGVHHLEELDEYIKNGGGGEISVGQYEIHPWLPRADIVEWCTKHNVVVEAYSPLVQGVRAKEPALTALTKKYNKSFAQVLIRWSLQKVLYSLFLPSLVLAMPL
jgi:diketogulonate reductase-like aldo/keto reductase